MTKSMVADFETGETMESRSEHCLLAPTSSFRDVLHACIAGDRCLLFFLDGGCKLVIVLQRADKFRDVL
jgi:hypothetical protein